MKAVWILLLSHLYWPMMAQKRWDGGGMDSHWQNPYNWHPDGVPANEDHVRLDNTLDTSSYLVMLPSGSVSVSVKSLRISAAAGKQLTLILPVTNTAVPGLMVTDTGQSFCLDPGSAFRNASGASSGEPIQLSGKMRISNGAAYIHNTTRGNAKLIDQLAQTPGTENGIFEFDVPGTGGYTVSLSGNTFGTLVLNSATAGGSKSYSGGGSGNLMVRGSLHIKKGAALTSTLTGNIMLAGSLVIDGKLYLSPTSGAASGRSLQLAGESLQSISGEGHLALNMHFRAFECIPYAKVRLERNIPLSHEGNKLLVREHAFLDLGEYIILGLGSFQTLPGSTLGIGSPAGIELTGSLGNVQSAVRSIDPATGLIFNGKLDQLTGKGLPDSILILEVDKPAGKLLLNKRLLVKNEVRLIRGIIRSTMDNLLTVESANWKSPVNQYGLQHAGWEKSFIDGPFTVRKPGNGMLELPCGYDSLFVPLRIEIVYAGASAITVDAHPRNTLDDTASVEAGIIRLDPRAVWNIRPGSNNDSLSGYIHLSWQGGTPASGSGAWKDSLCVAHLKATDTVQIWKRAGLSEDISGNHLQGWVRPRQPLHDWGIFSLAIGPPTTGLPIQQIDLEVECKSAKVDLRWLIQGSEDNATCLIEKSRNSLEFEVIGKLQFTHMKEGQVFTFTDSFPAKGKNLYRIRIVKEGSSTVLSPTRMVWLPFEKRIRLFPNPAYDKIHILIPQEMQILGCVVLDMSGRIRLQQKLEDRGPLSVDIEDLPPGTYILRITGRDYTESHIFLKGNQIRK